MKKKLSIIIALLLVAIFSINVGAASFKDLNGHWAKGYIEGQSSMGLLNGYPDGTFKPNKNLTNAEAIAVINRLTKVFKISDISFTDVKPNDWYFNEYRKAVYTGFVQDKADKAYPNKFISRGEVATMLAIVYGVEPNLALNNFKDLAANSAETAYINALNAIGVISGYPDGTFKPNQLVTRAEYSKMLNTIYTRLANPVRYPAAYLNSDKSELNSLLMKGSAYADGTSASVKDKYMLAYLNAKIVADNPKAIQAEIDLAAEKLKEAASTVDSEKSGSKTDSQEAKYRRRRRTNDDNRTREPENNEEDQKPILNKEKLKATIAQANALKEKVDTDYYKSNYSNALNNFLNALNEANKQVNNDNTTQNAIDKAEKDLADLLDSFNATASEIGQINNALKALKDANEKLKDDDLAADIATAEKALEDGMLHHEADEILNMLLEDLKAVNEHLNDVAHVNELKEKALTDLQAIIDGRISDLRDPASKIKNALKNETEDLDKIFDLVQKASKLKAQYDQALKDLKNMDKAADEYKKLLDSLNLPAENAKKTEVQAIIDEAKKAATGTDPISTGEIKAIWDKLNSINKTLKDEIELANSKKALEKQIKKVENFAEDKGITLNTEDAEKVKEANDLLKDATATKDQVDAKKKELEDLLTKLSRENKKAKANEENIALAEKVLKDDASLTVLKAKLDALKAANQGTDQAAIDTAAQELKDELAKVLPIKLIYKVNSTEKDIEGAIVPFEMVKDMTYDEVKALITPKYADGKEITKDNLSIDITSDTSESLVLKDADKKIVTFRKPSNQDKIRIKYTYRFAEKTFEGTLEYRSQDSGKRFQDIEGIYRALKTDTVDMTFFKNYKGKGVKLFDIVSGEDVTDQLKVKVMQNGVDKTNIYNKYDEGEYDLVFYYMEDGKEVSYTGTSKLIIDSPIDTKDLIYIYNPENAEYFIPMQDNDGRLIFGFNIEGEGFELPQTVRISAQETGATFLTMDGNADIKITFVDDADNAITSKDQLKAGMKLFAVLAEDIKGDLGDREVTFKAGEEKYPVPVLTNANIKH